MLDNRIGNCLDIAQRGSIKLQYLSRDEHFLFNMMFNKKRNN